MMVNFLMQLNCFFPCHHYSYSCIYLYRVDAQFSDARHYSWIHPYRDAGQFSDARQRFLYQVSIHRSFSDTSQLLMKSLLAVFYFEQKTEFSEPCWREWLGNRLIVLTLCRENFISLDE